MSTQTVLVVSKKSAAVGLLLTFFFGPLGMFYSTVTGAIVMFFVNCLVFVFTAGIGLVITWPIGLIWTWVAINDHNSSLVAAGTRPAPTPEQPRAAPEQQFSNTQQASQTQPERKEREVEEFQPQPRSARNRTASCHACDTMLEDGDNFCMNCGTERKKQSFCSSCGTTYDANSKFCNGCGQKLQA